MKSVILKQCSYTTFSILNEVSLSFPCASLGTLSNAKEDVDQKDKFLLLVTELHKWLDVFTASHGAITLLVNRVEFKIETLKILPSGFRFSYHKHFGDFTLLFCGGRLRNVQGF